MDKICSHCPERGPQPISNFSTYRNGAIRSYCKTCKRKWNNADYASKKATYSTRSKIRRTAVKDWINALKATLCCGKCGESHPACIQFHHRDPAEKEISLGDTAIQAWSIERIEKEIAKCDVLCANCHFKVHWDLRAEQKRERHVGVEPTCPPWKSGA